MGCAAAGPAVRIVAAAAGPKDRSAVEDVVMGQGLAWCRALAMSPETCARVHSPLPSAYRSRRQSGRRQGATRTGAVGVKNKRGRIFRRWDRHGCRQDRRCGVAARASRCRAARRLLLEAGAGRHRSRDRLRTVRRLADVDGARILPEAYVLPEPIAPHEAGAPRRYRHRHGAADRAARDGGLLVVEGAGGA